MVDPHKLVIIKIDQFLCRLLIYFFYYYDDDDDYAVQSLAEFSIQSVWGFPFGLVFLTFRFGRIGCPIEGAQLNGKGYKKNNAKSLTGTLSISSSNPHLCSYNLLSLFKIACKPKYKIN